MSESCVEDGLEMSSEEFKLKPGARVVFVHKRSAYERFVEAEADAQIMRLLRDGDVSVAQLEASHHRHNAGVSQALEAFRARGIELEVWTRPQIDARQEPFRLSPDDLVVVVGGDGTVLAASHWVKHAPVLALNSDPDASVGFLCSATASQADAFVAALLEGGVSMRQRNRLEVRINDAVAGAPVLNDVLFCHGSPAATSSYLLELDGGMEAQKSSGIWIATAAGSTAAIRSAGGVSMPLDAPGYQYRVREPYTRPGEAYRSVAGILDGATSRLRLISKMSHCVIYLDGPHIQFSIAYGDRVEIRNSPSPLRQLWLPALEQESRS